MVQGPYEEASKDDRFFLTFAVVRALIHHSPPSSPFALQAPSQKILSIPTDCAFAFGTPQFESKGSGDFAAFAFMASLVAINTMFYPYDYFENLMNLVTDHPSAASDPFLTDAKIAIYLLAKQKTVNKNTTFAIEFDATSIAHLLFRFEPLRRAASPLEYADSQMSAVYS